MSARLETVVSFQQLMERVDVFPVGCCLGNDTLVFQLFDARFRVFPENFKFVVIKKEMNNLICLALIELIIADQFNVIKV